MVYPSMEYPTHHVHFLGIHTHLNACVYTKKIRKVNGGIFHGIHVYHLKELHIN